MKLCIFLHPMLPANSEPFREYVLGPIIGFPFDTTLAVARMCFDGMLKEFPDIKWIIGHAGGAVPYLMERMDNGFRDFAECEGEDRSAAERVSQAAVLRHRDLQPAQPETAARQWSAPITW